MRFLPLSHLLSLTSGLALLALAGCGSSSELLGSVAGGGVTGYTAGNAFSPVGFRSTEIDETHHAITVTGSPATPRARLDKIAAMRAAEIGKELKLGWFKIEKSESGVECGKKVDGYKGPGTTQSDYAKVVVTVAYAKTAVDPSYQSADLAFDRVSAELQTEAVPPDVRAAAAQDVMAACGKK